MFNLLKLIKNEILIEEQYLSDHYLSRIINFLIIPKSTYAPIEIIYNVGRQVNEIFK